MIGPKNFLFVNVQFKTNKSCLLMRCIFSHATSHTYIRFFVCLFVLRPTIRLKVFKLLMRLSYNMQQIQSVYSKSLQWTLDPCQSDFFRTQCKFETTNPKATGSLTSLFVLRSTMRLSSILKITHVLR